MWDSRFNRRRLSWWFASACLFPLALAAAAEPLGNFAAVRALSQEAAAQQVPVRVEATVLGVDPASPWSLFLHDGSAGCYVKLLPGTNAPKFLPGMRLRVQGVSMPLGYYPSVDRAHAEVLGTAAVPAPVRLSAEQLFAPEFDSAWVEVPAVVVGYESKDQRFTLDVVVYGLSLKAELPLQDRAEERTAVLMQRPVVLRGVLGTIFNQQRQMTDRHFFVPSLDAVVPTQPPANGATAPLIAVAQMLTGGIGPQTHIRVKGVVTQAEAKGFYLRDESGSTLVQAARSGRFPPGTIVEVGGFGDVAPFRPLLRATRVVNLGETNPPAPVGFSFKAADLPRMHAERVSLTADFLGRREGRFETILQCRVGDQVFEALLPGADAATTDLAVGDRLRLTGICELTTTHALPRIGWVDGFRLHLPASGGVEIIARAPDKVNAFISALLEIARNYSLREENFFFAALRAYQELRMNYFEEIEAAADAFVQKHQIPENGGVPAARLADLLQTEFGYTIDEKGLAKYPELQGVRSVFNPKRRKLLLDDRLSERQKAFQFAKELGFNALGLSERPLASNMFRVQSFEETLNNYKAAYFAVAILVNRHAFVRDVQAFFERPVWDSNCLPELMAKYQASPEVLFQRFNILSRAFDLPKVFFLRVIHDLEADTFEIDKELHLNRRHQPHASGLNEKYCRRWLSITLLRELQNAQKGANGPVSLLSGAQRASFVNTGEEYLCLSVAKVGYPTFGRNVSVTIGILLDAQAQQTIRFWNDPAIPQQTVNVTCERCPLTDCQERAAPPTIVRKREGRKKIQDLLKKLTEK